MFISIINMHLHCNCLVFSEVRWKSMVEMSIKHQGKSDICQGKVRDMSGNFVVAGAWEP